MEIAFLYLTADSCGGSNLLQPIRDRLESELDPDRYGAAIHELRVTIALPQSHGKLTAAEKRQFGVCPRKRFTRKKGVMTVHYLSEFCTAADEKQPDLEQFNAAAKDVTNALRLVRTSLKTTDDFDVESFDNDVREILDQAFDSRRVIEQAANERRADFEHDIDQKFQEDLKSANPTRAIETYEATWPEQRPDPESFSFLEFRDEACCVLQWFHTLIGKQLRGMTPRLFIDFDDQLATPQLRAMARLACTFNYEAYFKLDERQRQAMVAEALRDGLTHFAVSTRQNPSPVAEVFAQMQAADFRFQGELKQKFPSPRLTARVEFEYGIQGMQLVAAFTAKGGRKIIARKPIGLCPPHPWLLRKLASCCKWNGGKFQIDFPPFKRSVETKGIG